MHVAVVVGPGLSSLENLPPCQTISTRQNVKQSMRAFASYQQYQREIDYWLQQHTSRSLNSWPIINEQLVIAIAAVFATAQR
jgi:hypothetical protein